VVDTLPATEIGRAVVTQSGGLFRGTPQEVPEAIQPGELRYHEGRIGGEFPRILR
jgi:hypothetical protein